LCFVASLERRITRFPCNRIGIAAVEPRSGLDRLRDGSHGRALADERLKIGIELAFARLFKLMGQRGEVPILVGGRPIDAEARPPR
jgi:hypothetical protein